MKTRCFHGFEKMGMGSEDVEVVGVEYSSETAEQRKKKKSRVRGRARAEKKTSRSFFRRDLDMFISEG